MLKYLEKAQMDVMKKYKKDLFKDIVLNKPDKLLFYTNVDSKDPVLHLIVGDLTILGFEEASSIKISTIFNAINLDNGFAEVGGKKEYKEMIVHTVSDFSTTSNITIPLITSTGRHWIRLTSYIIDEEKSLQSIEITIVTPYIQTEEEIFSKTHHDSLTGVFNKYTLDYHYGMRYKFKDFHVFYLDLDNFKKLNDSLGHKAGNQYLRDFAKILQKYEHGYSRFYRIGGDEFVGLFFETEERIVEIAQNIVTETKLLTKYDSNVSTSVSIGIIQANQRDDVIRKADALMYQAKRLGKNRYVFEVENEYQKVDTI